MKSAVKPTVPFSTLTKPQQRVAIVKDALSQLVNTKRYVVETGAFLQPPDVDVYYDTLRSLVQTATEQKPCTVCAMGAIFASQAVVNGDCSLSKLAKHSYNSSIMPYSDGSVNATNGFAPFITRYFTQAQLQMIEIAFETGMGGFEVADAVRVHRGQQDDDVMDWTEVKDDQQVVISIKAADRAMAFGERFKSDKDRLVAILTNIIENDGTFVP